MATIPGTPERSRMPGTPSLKGGFGMVSPEDLGSENFKQWSRLGSAIQGAGQAQMQWAIRKYEDQAQAEANSASSVDMENGAKERNRLQTITGANAANTPKDMEEFSKKLMEQSEKNLTTPRAKELYRQKMEGFNRSNSVAMSAYAAQEVDRYKRAGLEANINALMNNAVLNMGNNAVFADNLQKAKESNEQLYQGMPREYIDQKNQELGVMMAQNVAASLETTLGPQAALDFINSGVDRDLNSAKLKMQFDSMRAKFQEKAVQEANKKAVDIGTLESISLIEQGGDMGSVYVNLIKMYGSDAANTIIGNAGRYKGFAEQAKEKASKEESEKQGILVQQWARELAEAGLSQQEIEDRIRVEVPNAIKLSSSAAKSAFEAQKAQVTFKALKRTEKLDEEFNSVGGEVSRMPSFQQMTLEERTEYNIKKEKYDNSFGKPRPSPDRNIYNQVNKMKPDELNEWWSDPARRSADIEAMGGANSWYSQHMIWKFEKMSGAGKKDDPEKIAEHQTVDGFTDDVYRAANLYMMNSGKTYSSKQENLIRSQVMEYVSNRVDNYMMSHGMTKPTQVPVEVRNQIKAGALLEYKLKTPNWLLGNWWTDERTITAAEAEAQGIDITNAEVVKPEMLLPNDLRANHTVGPTQTIPQANGQAVQIDANIPRDKAPDNIEPYFTEVGERPVLQRDLVTGNYILIGSKTVYVFNADGSQAEKLEGEEADTARERLGASQEVSPMETTRWDIFGL